MNYIEYSLGKIGEAVAKDKAVAEEIVKAIVHNADPDNIGNPTIVPNKTETILLIETTSGSEKVRRVRILDIGDDYIIARGRNTRADEVFSFNHIASWQFAKYTPSEWEKGV